MSDTVIVSKHLKLYWFPNDWTLIKCVVYKYLLIYWKLYFPVVKISEIRDWEDCSYWTTTSIWVQILSDLTLDQRDYLNTCNRNIVVRGIGISLGSVVSDLDSSFCEIIFLKKKVAGRLIAQYSRYPLVSLYAINIGNSLWQMHIMWDFCYGLSQSAYSKTSMENPMPWSITYFFLDYAYFYYVMS